MKSTIAVVLAATALAGAGAVYLEVDRLSEEIRSVARARHADDRARGVVKPADDPGVDERGFRGSPDGVPNGVPHAPVGGAEGGDAGPEARVDDLESLSVRERLARLELAERARRAAVHGARGRGAELLRFPRFARSIDELARRLDLTPTQRDRVEDALDRGRRRIAEVLKIPDETGRSPHEQREERRRKIEKAARSGDYGVIPGLVRGEQSLLSRRIPGRNATYGEELGRVRRETRAEIEGNLDARQRKKLENTNTDVLVGGPGAGALSVSVLRASDGGGLFVGTGVVRGEGPDAEAEEGGGDDAGGSDTGARPPRSADGRGSHEVGQDR